MLYLTFTTKLLKTSNFPSFHPFLLSPTNFHIYTFFMYLPPNQYRPLPSNTSTPKCCPKLHAILNKYLGLNTVQIKRCVLSSIQATMTNPKLPNTNTVKRLRCLNKTSFSPFAFTRRSMRVVAEVQKIGPVQLLAKVRRPTARTL
jgi:hypothetical protein